MKQEPQPISWFAGFLTLLLPGLGHIFQGRVSKGVFFMASLLGLFHVGQAMAGWQAVFLPPIERPRHAPLDPRDPSVADRISKLPSAFYNRLHFVGQMWIGLPAFPAWLHYFDVPVPLANRFPMLRDYERTPDEREFNDFERMSDKTPSLGLIYTVIAGALNLLVIFDAVAGPLPTPKPQTPTDEGKKEAAS
ncbi:MAG: DUF6677 family protein [Gemmataceae bacterium]